MSDLCLHLLAVAYVLIMLFFAAGNVGADHVFLSKMLLWGICQQKLAEQKLVEQSKPNPVPYFFLYAISQVFLVRCWGDSKRQSMRLNSFEWIKGQEK